MISQLLTVLYLLFNHLPEVCIPPYHKHSPSGEIRVQDLDKLKSISPGNVYDYTWCWWPLRFLAPLLARRKDGKTEGDVQNWDGLQPRCQLRRWLCSSSKNAHKWGRLGHLVCFVKHKCMNVWNVFVAGKFTLDFFLKLILIMIAC